MTRLDRPARLNRGLLALLGIVLLAVGGFVLAGYFGRLRVLDPVASLAPGTGTPPTWALYLIALVAVALGLLCLRWLAAQLARAPKAPTWRLERDPGQGRTELDTSTAVKPFTEEVGAYPGVDTAHATLAGTRQTPALAVVIRADQDADLTAIRRHLGTHGLPRLRQALDLPILPVTAEFSFTTKAGPRTR